MREDCPNAADSEAVEWGLVARTYRGANTDHHVWLLPASCRQCAITGSQDLQGVSLHICLCLQACGKC